MTIASPTRRAAARDVIERVAADPEWFAETMLGHTLWDVPRQIMRAIAQPRARVAVRGCHASSKTFTASELVLWAPFAGGIAVTTAPTGRQVRRLIWAEVNTMAPAATIPLGGELLQTEFRIAADLYALGLSTDKGVNFQGFHAREGGFLLIVGDEAPGIEPAVFTAMEGVRAGGDVRVLLLGNPDVPSGPFYDAFGVGRSGWQTFTINAFAMPNFVDETRPDRTLTLKDVLALPEERLDYAPAPYLITRRFVREKHDEWGTDSPLWASKILGNFPDQAPDSLLALSDLEAAQRRHCPSEIEIPAQEWEAGIDVAGPGEDETVLAVRQGMVLRHLKAWPDPEPRGAVLAELAKFPHLQAIKVDTVGLGYYFARHLEDHGYLGRVVDVNVGLGIEQEAEREKYVNLKAQLYWGLRLRFKSGDVAGDLDQRTISQLASIRYRHNARGQVVIESKEDARKRGVKSPDRAEAIMLAYAALNGAAEHESFTVEPSEPVTIGGGDF